jgi:hypothetical protein
MHMVIGLMQSVPIPTKIVSLDPAHDEVYSIQYCDKVCVTCGRLVVFTGYSGFLHQKNCYMVESGVKHHNHNLTHYVRNLYLIYIELHNLFIEFPCNSIIFYFYQILTAW